MLHLDQGGKNQLYTWYFGGLLKESPNLDFDVFGLSYYPMWHGTMEGLQYNLNYLATTYNKEVCVVETAYAWTTEDGDGEGNVFISEDEEVGGYPATVEGQFEFMNDLESIILNVPDDKLPSPSITTTPPLFVIVFLYVLYLLVLHYILSHLIHSIE